jgi:hypothetical protein
LIFSITSPTGWDRETRKISLSRLSKAVPFLPFGNISAASIVPDSGHDGTQNPRNPNLSPRCRRLPLDKARSGPDKLLATHGRRGSAGDAGSLSINVPRTCEIARAAAGGPCRLGRTSGESANASTAGRVRPRTVGREKSERSSGLFAGRPPVEGEAQHSPPPRPHDR